VRFRFFICGFAALGFVRATMRSAFGGCNVLNTKRFEYGSLVPSRRKAQKAQLTM